MTTQAHFHALDATRFEQSYLHLPNPHGAAQWADMLKRRATSDELDELEEECRELLERCVEECGIESWHATKSGSIRRSLGQGEPKFHTMGTLGAPLSGAWKLLQATIGAAPLVHPLPYWFQLAYYQAWAGLTPPAALDTLLQTLTSTRLPDHFPTLLRHVDSEDYEGDMRSLVAFLERVAKQRPWIMAYEWGS